MSVNAERFKPGVLFLFKTKKEYPPPEFENEISIAFYTEIRTVYLGSRQPSTSTPPLAPPSLHIPNHTPQPSICVLVYDQEKFYRPND